jgi:hypothetical protein
MTELAQRAVARDSQHLFDREWWQREVRSTAPLILKAVH